MNTWPTCSWPVRTTPPNGPRDRGMWTAVMNTCGWEPEQPQPHHKELSVDGDKLTDAEARLVEDPGGWKNTDQMDVENPRQDDAWDHQEEPRPVQTPRAPCHREPRTRQEESRMDNRQRPSGFQWTHQGEPICLIGNDVGHMYMSCTPHPVKPTALEDTLRSDTRNDYNCGK